MNLNINVLIEIMSNCFQRSGQSVYQHGLDVYDHFLDLQNNIFKLEGERKVDWKIPDWLNNYTIPHFWNVIDGYDPQTIKEYLIFHDCGKPFCKVIDGNGKMHFPNHAQISFNTFNLWFDDEIAADLVLKDMEIHTLLPNEEVVRNYFQTEQHAWLLLLVALCELHSNAILFGGFESDNFKIKWKKLNKIGKRGVSLLKF